jgi:hypothetical protein
MVVGVLVLGLIDQRLLQDLWIYGSFVLRASSNVIVVIVQGGPCDMDKRQNMRDAVIKRLSMYAQCGFRWRSLWLWKTRSSKDSVLVCLPSPQKLSRISHSVHFTL